LRTYRVVLALRYTRMSCRPYGARMELDRLVLADSEQDAVRQACLCLDADLERLMSEINAINVSAFPVDILLVEQVGSGAGRTWNETPFPASRCVPPHLQVRLRPGSS